MFSLRCFFKHESKLKFHIASDRHAKYVDMLSVLDDANNLKEVASEPFEFEQWRRNQGGAGCWRTPINFASYVGTPSLPNTRARDTAGPGVDHYTIDTDYTELEREWDFAT